ncbi:MAG: TonB-dependent receptor [Flavobacteriales bacterium]|nr:TonB-dependent receptor [Flavobacteriales bacterium]
MFLFFNLKGQEATYILEGLVLSEDLVPLLGGSIEVHELGTGTTADKDGKYSLEFDRPGHYHLHISFIGFETQSQEIIIENSRQQMNFYLHPSSIEIKEHVVESSLLKGDQEHQSMTIDVRNRADLAKTGGNNLVESLTSIPGVDMINIGTAAAKPVIRGLSQNRVLVAENDIKQEGQQWGSDHGLELDQNRVDQVEVIKGPAALIYGAEALAGVVNISSDQIPKKNTLKAELNLGGQSNAQVLVGSGNLEWNKNGLFGGATYSNKRFSDFQTPTDSFEWGSYIFPLVDNNVKNTAGAEESYAAFVGAGAGWGNVKLTLSHFGQDLGFFPSSHGRPDEDQLLPDGDRRNIDDPNQSIQHQKVSLNSNILFERNWLEIDAAVQKNVRNEFERFLIKEDNPKGLALGLDLLTYTVNAHYHQHYNDNLDAVFGISAQTKENTYSGVEFLISNFRRSEAGIYSFMEYRKSDKLTLNAGLRADMGIINIEEALKPTYNSDGTIQSTDILSKAIDRKFFTGTAALGWSFRPDHYRNFKWNLSSGYRYPNEVELSADGVHHGSFRYERGNSALDIERNVQIDFQWQKHKNDFILQFTPFASYYFNYLYLRPTGSFAPEGTSGGQIYEYTQNTAFHGGFEFLYDFHIVEPLHTSINLQSYFGVNIDEQRPLPFIPPAKLMLDLEYEWVREKKKLSEIDFGISPRYVAPQILTERNELETPQYFLLNAQVSMKIAMWKTNESIITFGVKNLLNTPYFDHISRFRIIGITEPGRNFFINLSIPIVSLKLRSNEALK